MALRDDVEELGTISLKLFRKCRSSADFEVQNLGPSVRTIANSLDDFEEHLTSNPLSENSTARLQSLLSLTRAYLNQLKALIQENTSVAAASHIHLPDSSQGEADIQSKIERLANDLPHFHDELMKTEGRVSRALDFMVKSGDKLDVERLQESTQGGFPGAWDHVANRLEEKGITKETVQASRTFVIEWVRWAENEGRLLVPYEHPGSVHQLQAEEAPPSYDTIPVRGDETQIQSPGPGDFEGPGNIPLPLPPAQVILPPSPSSVLPTVPRRPIRHQSGDLSIPSLAFHDDQRTDTTIERRLSSHNQDYHEDDLYSVTPSPRRSPSILAASLSNQTSPTLSNTLVGPSSNSSPYIAKSQPLSPGGIERSIFKDEEIGKEVVSDSQFHSEDFGKEIAHTPPPIPPKTPEPRNIPIPASPAWPGNHLHLSPVQSTPSLEPISTAATFDLTDSGPPSPILEDEEPYIDLDANAETILRHFSENNWQEAKAAIEVQISSAEAGAFVIQDNVPVQPNIRYLRFLIGVCASFGGDFFGAKEAFNAVLANVHQTNHLVDSVEMAAARWLGDTCVVLNQGFDAVFAWAVAVQGYATMYGYYDSRAVLIATELRSLNFLTNALATIKLHAMGNPVPRDVTKVMMAAPLNWKYNKVVSTLEYVSRTSTGDLRTIQGKYINELYSLSHGDLTRPLTGMTVLPFEHDALFRVHPSIELMMAISKPRVTMKPKLIPTATFSSAKTLSFRTQRDGQWLIDAVRECLNAYAIEFKISESSFLIRLSQTQSRIAYYSCYALKVRKVPLRSAYGIKLTDVTYSTRNFPAYPGALAALLGANEVPVDPATVRDNLIKEMCSYLEELDKSGRKPMQVEPGNNIMELQSTQRFELGDTGTMLPELMGSDQIPTELDSRSVWKRKRKPVAETPIFELPG
ncbi:hypothetical protein BT63DRAFT_453053 [Microthyrium microscopicum]|uniref:Uncharacterized protein n=1 Tax=Microthyrium microscopicum TaxID=703497 RepID=A0A6A6UJX0_9PEZI|nr:hypothetical protein BT63DRAFT_453053 [Microthyrium microscopicum]